MEERSPGAGPDSSEVLASTTAAFEAASTADDTDGPGAGLFEPSTDNGSASPGADTLASPPGERSEIDGPTPWDLLPATGVVAKSQLYQSVYLLDAPENVQQGPARTGALDPTAPLRLFEKPTEGVIVTTEQEWYPAGIGLGRLLYSLSLAPGESTRVAVVDWTRQVVARLAETTNQTEQAAADATRNRGVTEVTEALAREEQRGDSETKSDSSSSSDAGSAGLSMFGGSFGLSSSASKTSGRVTNVSRSFGTRDISENTSQRIAERTNQLATSARDLRATVVQETSEKEAASVSTRIVTNYNHMHALTIEYWEVIQHYKVRTRTKRCERCLFVPMAPVTFDDSVLKRYKSVLRAAAPDSPAPDSWAKQFDAVNEFATSTYPTRCNSGASYQSLNALVTKDGAQDYFGDEKPDADAPSRAEALEVYWYEDSIYAVRLRMAGGAPDVCLQNPESIEPGGRAIIEFGPRERIRRIVLTSAVRTPGEGHSADPGIFAWTRPLRQISITTTDRDSVTLGPGVPSGPVHEERIDVADAAICGLYGIVAPPRPHTALDALGGRALEVTTLGFYLDGPQFPRTIIDHLNDNALHYSQAIWAAADELALASQLAGYEHSDPHNDAPAEPLGGRLDPDPVASTGNYLGFRWQFPEEPDRQKWLRDHGLTEAGRWETTYVSLPTNGVFAEAVLGRSNSAEKLDATRFWKWQDSEIPFGPPEIAPVSTDSRAQPISLQPGQLGQPAVVLPSLGSLPEPTSGAAVLQAMAAGTMFRDMSGMSAAAEVLKKGIEVAAGGDQESAKRAMEAMTQANQHMEAMSRIAVDGAARIAPLVLGGPAGGASALARSSSDFGALLNYGSRASGAHTAPGNPHSAAEASPRPANGRPHGRRHP